MASKSRNLPKLGEIMREASSMPVVILAGGQGFRSAEDVQFHPKPMSMIGNRPLLWHLLKSLSDQGFSEFIICLGSKGNEIRDYFLNYHTRDVSLSLKISTSSIVQEQASAEDENWNIALVETGKTATTGQRLRTVEELIGGRTFACLYGDVLSNVDIHKLIAFHRSHAGTATITAAHPRSRFNVLTLTEDNNVKTLLSEPVLEDWVNGGYFVFEPMIFDYLDSSAPLEGAPLEKLSAEGNLYAYKHEGFWQAVDTQRDLDYLESLLNLNEQKWKV